VAVAVPHWLQLAVVVDKLMEIANASLFGKYAVVSLGLAVKAVQAKPKKQMQKKGSRWIMLCISRLLESGLWGEIQCLAHSLPLFKKKKSCTSATIIAFSC
jgi:hypothetical protein